MTDSSPQTTPISLDEGKAIGLYAVLARDAMDFAEMVGEATDETLRVLGEMLRLVNPEHDHDTRALNRLGLGIVVRELRERSLADWGPDEPSDPTWAPYR